MTIIGFSCTSISKGIYDGCKKGNPFPMTNGWICLKCSNKICHFPELLEIMIEHDKKWRLIEDIKQSLERRRSCGN